MGLLPVQYPIVVHAGISTYLLNWHVPSDVGLQAGWPPVPGDGLQNNGEKYAVCNAF
jgi:hypothetical protein